MTKKPDLPATAQDHAVSVDLAQALDPIAVLTSVIGTDPSIAELVAFRRSLPDVKLAAREAKRLRDEAMRIRVSDLDRLQLRRCAAALTMAALACKAVTLIWPADDLDIADAKLALAETTGPHLLEEHDHVVMLDNELARRVRIRRAAFAVGELMLPPAPKPPGADSRGLAEWPTSRFDLTAMLPPRGGPPVMAPDELQRWIDRMEATPDLGGLGDRVARLFDTSDRLRHLARVQPGADPVELRTAAEGALIAAYLTAAQVAIRPVPKRSTAEAIRQGVARAIDGRAGRPDPLHMQASLRVLFDDGVWLARLIDPDRMVTTTPSWTEIV
ncbi:hypothetical protein [Bosea sp. (in: a-proteobacteria)]|uniref:hypothetical protein n=1 Tax=Bosea sp. (in: a-proteobacteria) TaxID=1871050 RepID=UPI00120299D8|nr:hypothetical protein [Bosea sp. (in: a-proteobacteria)]TAJ33794.1 MAG: hypothetical protein EPO59_03980 [Bosea sp. (in: a-proteobacteria)]